MKLGDGGVFNKRVLKSYGQDLEEKVIIEVSNSARALTISKTGWEGRAWLQEPGVDSCVQKTC